MKQLTLTREGESYIYTSIVRVQSTDMGNYTTLYVFLNDLHQAQALAFSPFVSFCGGVWTHNRYKDYNYQLRIQVDNDTKIDIIDVK